MNPDLELATQNLIGHIEGMLYWAELMSDAQFDFTYQPAAPNARTLVTHAWQWLVCDRQHILEPDTKLHSLIADAPDSKAALIAQLRAEKGHWETLLFAMTDEKLREPRHQFGDQSWEWSVRGIVYHMLQNVIYKHGQLSYLAYAFGLDGTEAYTAPFPNVYYQESKIAK
jgi:hypothetical protein